MFQSKNFNIIKECFMKRINEFMVGIVFVAAMTVLAYFTIVRGEFLAKKNTMRCL
jgi:hypothetical protein